jgi:hypothetical protein
MCIKCDRKIILLGLLTTAVDEFESRECIDLMEMLSNLLVEKAPGFKQKLFYADALQIVDGKPEYDEANMLTVMEASLNKKGLLRKDTIESMFKESFIELDNEAGKALESLFSKLNSVASHRPKH